MALGAGIFGLIGTVASIALPLLMMSNGGGGDLPIAPQTIPEPELSEQTKQELETAVEPEGVKDIEEVKSREIRRRRASEQQTFLQLAQEEEATKTPTLLGE